MGECRGISLPSRQLYLPRNRSGAGPARVSAQQRSIAMNRRTLLSSAGLMAVLPAGTGLASAAARPVAGNSPAPFVTARDGTKLFVREWGKGQPVLFLHSWSLSSEIWTFQMARLAEQGFRCISFDRRGHGRSDDSSRGYDYDTLTGDVETVVDAFGLRDFVLVGHSMGAGEAIRHAAGSQRSRVRKLVLVSAAAPCLIQSADNSYGVPRAVLDQTTAQILRDFPNWIETNKLPFFTAQTSPAMMNSVAGIMLRTPVRVAYECARTFMGADLRPCLAKISAPTLVIHGDKDVSAPLAITGQRLAVGIPGAQLKVYE